MESSGHIGVETDSQSRVKNKAKQESDKTDETLPLTVRPSTFSYRDCCHLAVPLFQFL